MAEFTQKELSAFAGYTYRRLLDINKALPEEDKLFQKGEGGKYDLALFLRNWVKFNVARASREDDDLDVVKAAHENVKMEKSQLELRRMRAELVEVASVSRVWADIATMVTQKFLTLAPSLAPMLVMMENPEMIERKIDEAIRDTLNEIADVPLPDRDMSYAEPEVDEE